MGKFSRWQTDYIFLIFPWRQFAWNVKSCFLGKNISNCCLLKILPSILSVKDYIQFWIWKFFANFVPTVSWIHHLILPLPNVLHLYLLVAHLEKGSSGYMLLDKTVLHCHVQHLSQGTTKLIIRQMWPVKTQISLYILPVWQGSHLSLFG